MKSINSYYDLMRMRMRPSLVVVVVRNVGGRQMVALRLTIVGPNRASFGIFRQNTALTDRIVVMTMYLIIVDH